MRVRRRDRGSNLVEMAFALPVFMLFVTGIMVFAQVYSHQMALDTAAREAARMGAVGHADATVMRRINSVTRHLDHDPSRFSVRLDRTNARYAVRLTYVEECRVPVLSVLFNGKVLAARAEHVFETDWVER